VGGIIIYKQFLIIDEIFIIMINDIKKIFLLKIKMSSNLAVEWRLWSWMSTVLEGVLV